MVFSEATAVKQIDSHTYEANFHPQWVIGTVPHGGYVTSCFLSVVRKHFDTTLLKQNQPHTMTLHLDFLRRTSVGLATFKVKDIKLGRQASVIHVTLYQDDREEIVGYITNTNLAKEEGVTFPTQWSMHPKTLPITSFSQLEADQDPNWAERREWPFIEFRKATTHLRSWFPRQGQPSPACLDIWYAFKDSQSRFTNESLGFVCDTFPQIIETYTLGGLDSYSVEFEQKYDTAEQVKIMQQKGHARMWYPTVLLNLDVKKALPEEGVKFLFVRLQAKQIRNGRYDLEVLIFDAEELVAISQHVVYAVGAERNTAVRNKAASNNDSKL